ncbi:bifunctional riboflavin kinase/FAD synthetase [Buchnera aphidicola (Muscaphis stroyani)]|uniref:Riboflavin biosynthesis protein n=1 Tax=Buchnera aphidicola (Muscaphis stroyani) TaxID=1241869 RepID=A0A4D6Y573_9GAMM|nr:bifunctional riboflavin kinase/FAD synthetase [Buchnera aphidicola]QCI24249.1 bifunctional riboflavin kinase/FAD synthetase [Buchnera aphidicola (Muscaphis stroyani)]
MKIIRGINHLKNTNSNSVVSIGNFDGIHLGHQKLLSYVCKVGEKYKILTTIILFEPQPLEFLRKENIPSRLTSFHDKIKYISLWKIDQILCIKFNDYFSSLSAKDFIIKILINKLHIKFIVIGNDFRFGFQRNGNVKFLKKLGKKHNFKVILIQTYYQNNIKISSTNIRKLLSEDKIELSNSFLGHPFSISGKVIHGNAIGRTIGYPTANILLNNNLSITNGVYAVKIRCFFNKKFLGISNIKNKNNYVHKKRLLEVHLFNQNINLYGEKIEVFIYKKIRNEFIFHSKDELKNQISKDVEIVKNYFKINQKILT